MALTRYEGSKLARALISAKRATQTARHKAGETVRTLVRIGEVGAGAGLMGYLAGARAKKAKTDPTITTGPNLLGVPMDLAIGVAGQAIALMGVGGAGAEEHIKNFADGCLACYVSTMGYEYGLGLAPTDSKALPRAVLGGAALTPAELAKMAMPVQGE